MAFGHDLHLGAVHLDGGLVVDGVGGTADARCPSLRVGHRVRRETRVVQVREDREVDEPERQVVTRDGRTLVQWADERYRGGPSNPISDEGLDGKFRMCAEGVIDADKQDELLALVRGIDKGADVARVISLISGTSPEGHAAKAAAAE